MSLYTVTGCQASGKTMNMLIESTKWLDVFKTNALWIQYDEGSEQRNPDNIVSSNSSSFNDISHRFRKISVRNIFESCHLWGEYDFICIDEIQFFEDLENAIKELLRLGKHIFCSGLNTNWKGEDFGQVKELLKYSTTFIVLNAICEWCKQDLEGTGCLEIPRAARTGKLIPGNTLIDIGGAEKYVPLCLKHHKQHLSEIHGINI